MTKLKAPLISLSASGSIGDVISFDRRGRQNRVRTKPVPTDARSLAQMYQRWDYQDAAALWHFLSAADKQAWETSARRLRITGFNYWMRTRLNTLPNLAGRWHFDTIADAQSPDSSKNTNPATIVGAQLVDGIIDHALAFDGLDDLASIPTITTPAVMTFECLITYLGLGLGGYPRIHSRGVAPWGMEIGVRRTVDPRQLNVFLSFDDDTISGWQPVTLLTFDTRYHLTVKFDGTWLRVVLDGDPILNDNTWAGKVLRQGPSVLANVTAQTESLHAILDEVIIYDELTPTAQDKRHAERRYPL